MEVDHHGHQLDTEIKDQLFVGLLGIKFPVGSTLFPTNNLKQSAITSSTKRTMTPSSALYSTISAPPTSRTKYSPPPAIQDF